jgi:hypothetical protein
LDPDAVEKAMRLWSDAENRRQLGPTPEALGDALLRIQLPHAEQPASPGVHLGGHLLTGVSAHGAADAGLGLDLVAIGIHAISRLFEGDP